MYQGAMYETNDEYVLVLFASGNQERDMRCYLGGLQIGGIRKTVCLYSNEKIERENSHFFQHALPPRVKSLLGPAAIAWLQFSERRKGACMLSRLC